MALLATTVASFNFFHFADGHVDWVGRYWRGAQSLSKFEKTPVLFSGLEVLPRGKFQRTSPEVQTIIIMSRW